MLDVIALLESEVRGYVRAFPTVFTSATGSVLKDASGRKYIDFFAGAGTLNYGHNNPRAKNALLEYIQNDGVQHGLDTATEAKIEFIRDFHEVILKPRNLEYKIQFTGPTGTNSVEAAIKLARKVKKRSHIVAFTNAYHGHSLGSLALTANQFYHDEHYGSHNNVTHLPFDGYLEGLDSADLIKKMLGDAGSGLPHPAAIILETIQCEGGINLASFEWLRKIERICRQHDILLIVDDIQVGNGRTGTFFSFEDAGISPDLVCLSKSLGGGLPIALVLIRPEIDQWKPGQHTGTFRGNNLAFVAGRALLGYWRNDELAQQTKSNGKLVRSALQDITARYSQFQFEFRGRGMVWGIDVKDGELAKRVSIESFQHGLIIETAGVSGQVIKLLPALTIEPNQLADGLQILKQSIASTLNAGPIAMPQITLPIENLSVSESAVN